MLLLLVVLAASPAGVQADVSRAWHIERATVRVVCPMTVGGSFEARTAALDGTLRLATARPAAFAGDLNVDLRSLETGIGLRDDHMRNEYLEVGKGEGFDRAVLSEIRLGDVDADSFEGKTAFDGTLQIHGAKHPIAGEAVVRREAGRVRVEAAFPVALANFGITRPQYLGVGVRDEVQVKVSLVATAAEAAP